MDNRFFGLTLTDVLRFSYQFSVRNDIKHHFKKESEMAGDDFVNGFLTRHQTLSLRTPEATSAAGAAGFNKVVVADFYRLLEHIYERHSFIPSRIFNRTHDRVKQDANILMGQGCLLRQITYRRQKSWAFPGFNKLNKGGAESEARRLY